MGPSPRRGEVRTPAERLLLPVQEFMAGQAAGGILLLACALVALAWANSPWAAGYTSLWQTRVSIGAGAFQLAKPLVLWVNDGLMAVFFFVVGLEIKREVLVGELASPRQAVLPVAAAAGGMVLPAAFYLAFNAGTPAAAGWGIPMATDIAFALGVLALLGPGVPLALKVFLTALAIVDDLGAVLVIALFYTEQLAWGWLGTGAAVLALLAALNRLHARHPLPYLTLGAVLWLAFLKSGVHATVAGVLLAMTIPIRTRISPAEFVVHGRELLGRVEAGGSGGGGNAEMRQAALQALETACRHVETPLHRLEHALHPWVGYLIMPVFALANAGVDLGGGAGSLLGHPVSLGVLVGLALGKPIGITAFVWLAWRGGLAELPGGATWRKLVGVGCLGGIGFTMSLFVTGLAFPDVERRTAATAGIFAASLLSGIAGYLLLRGPRGGRARRAARGDKRPRHSGGSATSAD